MNILQLHDCFRALANHTRLRILWFLHDQGPLCVGDIVEGTGLQQSTVSMGLQQLLRCRFVRLEHMGKEHCYSLNVETVGPLFRLMERHVRAHVARTQAS